MGKGESRQKSNFNVLNRIKEECKKRNWSDYQLAKSAEITQSTISTWYNKDIEPTIVSIERICNGLGISLAQFFNESKEEMVYLTEEQKDLLDGFGKLEPDQKNAIIELIELFNK